MPLRPLKPNGQPKIDKELTRDEQASRHAELEDDRRTFAARGARLGQEQHFIDLYEKSQRAQTAQ